MKKARKKIIVGIMVVGLLATVGVVVVSAHPVFFSELTDEQKEEIKDLRTKLREDGATREEMREAMRTQLEEYGIELPTREEMLDMQIEHTKQRLEILERTKELIQENPEITNEEIREIIQNEFELEMPNGDGWDMIYQRGFHRGPGCGPRGFMDEE